MPDVAELLSELDGLSEHPPAAPRPAAEIRHRARRRRHRRRIRRTGLAAAALVVVAATGALALRSDEGGGSDVDTGPVAPPDDPDAVPPTTVDDGVVRVLEGRGLSLDPADDLDDGDRVTLTLATDPGGPVEVTQCAAEVVDHAGSLDPSAAVWCGSTFYLRDAAGAPDMSFEVTRRLGTPDGTVDCAEAPGRCVLAARPIWPSRQGQGATPAAEVADAMARRYAPLVFRDDLPPLREPEARLLDAGGPIEDGQVVRVEASGFGRVSDVRVAQCTGPAEDLASAGEATIAERCDGGRFARLRTDDAGEVVADVRIFHDIGLGDPARTVQATTWEPCAPCSLVVRGIAPENVVLPLEIAPTDDPVRPVLRVTPAGPYDLGQQLRVEGSGFQIRTEVVVPLCATTTSPGDTSSCAFPAAAYTTTDDRGTFVIDGYPLGAGETNQAHCYDGPGACSLRWHSDRGQVGADVPIDMSG